MIRGQENGGSGTGNWMLAGEKSDFFPTFTHFQSLLSHSLFFLVGVILLLFVVFVCVLFLFIYLCFLFIASEKHALVVLQATDLSNVQFIRLELT